MSICLLVASTSNPEHSLRDRDIGSEPDRARIRRDNCFSMIFRTVDVLLAESRAEGKLGEWSKKLERLLQVRMKL